MEALLHRVEVECRNRDVLGINHPDKGIHTEVGTIGKVEDTTEGVKGYAQAQTPGFKKPKLRHRAAEREFRRDKVRLR